VGTGNGDHEVLELPSVRGYSYPVSGAYEYGDPPGWGLGVRLTTSPCKKKFVKSLLKKVLEEAKAHILAVVPLMMMMIPVLLSSAFVSML
jgi:hypothetical protein